MTTSLRVVLGLLGFSLFGLAVTGQSVYTRLSYLWFLLLVGNWAFSKVALRGVTFRRVPYLRRAQVGQIFEERFDIQNTSRLPRLWLEVVDRAELPGSKGSRVHTLVGGKQGRSYLERTRLVQRGVFMLGPTELAAGDPFGLFPVKQEIEAKHSVMVYPMIMEVHTFPSPPGLLPGGEALRRRTHHVTPNAATIRDYEPGDPMNRIHWASTARRNELMVKEFELDPLAEVWIFLDAEQSVHASLPFTPVTDVEDALFRPLEEIGLAPSTEEYGATIAASLARYYLRRGRAVGLVTGGHSIEVLPPDRGGRQLGKILESLAILRAEGTLPISALVTGQARHLPRGSTVVLVTPSVREDIVLVVDQLIRLGLRPVVVLLVAETFGGAPGTERLVAGLGTLGISLTQVSKDDDIGEALSTAGALVGELSRVPIRTTEQI
jgi:uncharacterized protein (DUF58 family)